MGEVDLLAQRIDALGIADRVEPGTLAGLEAHVLAERIGNHQDVGKQDRGVEAEPPDRLQRGFDRGLGVVAELKERAGLSTDRPVFRQVASGLAHQP